MLPSLHKKRLIFMDTIFEYFLLSKEVSRLKNLLIRFPQCYFNDTLTIFMYNDKKYIISYTFLNKNKLFYRCFFIKYRHRCLH